MRPTTRWDFSLECYSSEDLPPGRTLVLSVSNECDACTRVTALFLGWQTCASMAQAMRNHSSSHESSVINQSCVMGTSDDRLLGLAPARTARDVDAKARLRLRTIHRPRAPARASAAAILAGLATGGTTGLATRTRDEAAAREGEVSRKVRHGVGYPSGGRPRTATVRRVASCGLSRSR